MCTFLFLGVETGVSPGSVLEVNQGEVAAGTLIPISLTILEMGFLFGVKRPFLATTMLWGPNPSQEDAGFRLSL